MTSNSKANPVESITVGLDRWQREIEPILNDHFTPSSPAQRRRARIEPWNVELVGDDKQIREFFSLHWPPGATGSVADTYCYCVGRTNMASDPRRLAGLFKVTGPVLLECPALGRLALFGATNYGHALEMVGSALHMLSTRTSSSGRHGAARPPDLRCVLRGAAIEYQPHHGETRGLCLLGHDHCAITSQALGLTRASLEHSLLESGFLSVQVSTAKICRLASRQWWPTRLARILPFLTPYLCTNPGDGLDWDDRMRVQVEKYRDPADLLRAVEDGSFPEPLFAELSAWIGARAQGFALVDQPQLWGPGRCLESAQVTDLVLASPRPTSLWILQGATSSEILEFGQACFSASGTDSAESRASSCGGLERLLADHPMRLAKLNTCLPYVPTQFCLRHYMEGLSDSIRLLGPSDLGGDDPARRSMYLEVRESAGFPGAEVAGGSVFSGSRQVQVLSFEKDGRRVEAAAFDLAVNGFAQLRAAWPGQVADFFARHAPLHAIELFTECRNDVGIAIVDGPYIEN